MYFPGWGIQIGFPNSRAFPTEKRACGGIDNNMLGFFFFGLLSWAEYGIYDQRLLTLYVVAVV
jgi:hypothetical protein